MTRQEAADLLGVPAGTVAARLHRARALLAKRLAQHGRLLAVGSVAVVLAQNAATAGMPVTLASATVRAASLWAEGAVTVNAVVSAQVISLSKGVLRTMLLKKIQAVVAIVLVVGASASGVEAVGRQTNVNTTAGVRPHRQTRAVPVDC